jgi:hypothetical protein
MRARLLVTTVLLSFLALNPVSAMACSVCYGDPDSNMSKGLGWGILVLLGVVLAVLGGIATFFVYLAKKSSTHTV